MRCSSKRYTICLWKQFIPLGISAVGRAPALQAGGHEFDSRILHLNLTEQCQAYIFLNSSAVEHSAVNRRAVGSNPTRGVVKHLIDVVFMGCFLN